MKPEYLKHYIEAINKIEDYFEYRSESVKDRSFVYGVLDKLSDSLGSFEINNRPLQHERDNTYDYNGDSGD